MHIIFKLQTEIIAFEFRIFILSDSYGYNFASDNEWKRMNPGYTVAGISGANTGDVLTKILSCQNIQFPQPEFIGGIGKGFKIFQHKLCCIIRIVLFCKNRKTKPYIFVNFQLNF